MKLLICGDFVLTDSNEKFFADRQIEKVIGSELVSLIHGYDMACCNLEAPITNSILKLPKAGPNLKISIGTEQGIRDLGISLVGLANNHIMDYQQQGLSDTILCLQRAGIDCFGVGRDITSVQSNFTLSRDTESNVSFYACAENEFTVAGKNQAGANPFDPLVSFEEVKELKEMCGGYLIVLYHGGKEYYRYPSPNLQRVCRKFVDSGANLVVCQHSHCVGCEERYHEGIIVYGQGDFLFDHGNDEYSENSLLIGVDTCGGKAEITYHVIVKDGFMIRIADETESQVVLDKFYSRSENIQCDGFIEREYEKLCDKIGGEYIGIVRGFKWGNVILNKFLYHKKWDDWYKDSELLSIRNIIECESHREAFLRYLKRRV